MTNTSLSTRNIAISKVYTISVLKGANNIVKLLVPWIRYLCSHCSIKSHGAHMHDIFSSSLPELTQRISLSNQAQEDKDLSYAPNALLIISRLQAIKRHKKKQGEKTVTSL